jgi:hypothetical protein
VRYVAARPLRGDSDNKGPESRTRFLQRGIDTDVAMSCSVEAGKPKKQIHIINRP